MSNGCSAEVYDALRWGGFPCQRKGVVVENGKAWCKQHAPSAVVERKRKADERYEKRQKQAMAPYAVIAALKAECERLKAETKRREEGELDCNLPAWREIDRLRAALAAAKAQARELAKAVIDCLAGVSVSHDVDCLCADCIARRLARRILAETPAPSHDDKIHDAALEEAASCAETCRRCCGIGDDASPQDHCSCAEVAASEIRALKRGGGN